MITRTIVLLLFVSDVLSQATPFVLSKIRSSRQQQAASLLLFVGSSSTSSYRNGNNNDKVLWRKMRRRKSSGLGTAVVVAESPAQQDEDKRSSIMIIPNNRNVKGTKARISSSLSSLDELFFADEKKNIRLLLPRDHNNSNHNDRIRLLPLVALPLLLKEFYARYLEQWYKDALTLKCPFLRRRKLDLLEGIETIVRAFIYCSGGGGSSSSSCCSGIIYDNNDNDNNNNNNNRYIMPPLLSCRGNTQTWTKSKGRNTNDVCDMIRKDWKETTRKGYYVTGKLNAAIYRDDCFFDGPDPDMPVKGLIKYLQVASQLFDPSVSTCQLLSLHQVVVAPNKNGQQGRREHHLSATTTKRMIHATWRMNAVMRLPWRPQLPEVIGSTTYHLDHDHLIYKHTETWDNISVMEAFQSIVPKTWEDMLIGKITKPSTKIKKDNNNNNSQQS